MTIKLVDYGSILTGRDFGAKVLKELQPTLKPPITLDFKGVNSLGSSFGDEVVPPIARLQNDKIEIKNTNRAIQKTLRDIANDGKVEVIYK